MEKLKIGDKLYYKKHSNICKNITYLFATVERLTKTQAILSNGVRLVNLPNLDTFTKKTAYSIVGDFWEKWYIETAEIIDEAKKETERQTIVYWFKNKKFSEDEMCLVYNTFKELGTL